MLTLVRPDKLGFVATDLCVGGHIGAYPELVPATKTRSNMHLSNELCSVRVSTYLILTASVSKCAA